MAETETPVRKSRRPLQVLLVDDSLVNQDMTSRMLRKWGHTVTQAGTGRQAVAALDRHEFDVVLMDVNMPEMDGLAATRLIREKERETGAHVPIIAMTAYAEKGDADRCIAAGMDAYISKPMTHQELFETLETRVP
jgi:two-component system, sensor histidine kinase and response regulator